MKRSVSLTKYFFLLVFALSVFCIYGTNVHASEVWDGKSSEKFAAGSGTKNDPYQISNGAQLSYLANAVDNEEEGQKGKYYELTDDIDLGGHNWNPIGYAKREGTTFYGGNYFYGTFDGNGHTIKNLNITQSDPNNNNSYYGLFAWNSGTIQNVNIENANIDSKGVNYIGGISGINEGNIKNCAFNGKMTVYNGAWFVGGIVGYQYDSGVINNCHNSSYIKGNSKNNSYIGGIIGYNGSGDVLNCVNEGNIEGYNQVGGIAGNNDGYKEGYVDESLLDRCMNFGDITGNCEVGGVVGCNYRTGILTNSFNIGNVNGNKYAGGITGSIISIDNEPKTVQYCVNIGKVECNQHGNAITGEIFAQGTENKVNLENCYYVEGSAKNSYWINDEEGSGTHNISEVKKLTVEQLTDQNNFKGFDFQNVWEMSTYYPVIRGLSFNKDLLKQPEKPKQPEPEQPTPGDNENPDTHIHSYGDWKHDKTGHWRECTVCGEKTKKAKHTEVLKKKVAATCDKDGYKLYVCNVCGATRKITIKATGHHYGAGKVTKAPTSSKTGVMTYTCKDCGKTKTKTIAKLPKTKITKLSARSKGFKVTWKKAASVSGYQIRYSKKGKSAKVITINGNKTTSKVIKKLSKKKKYSVQIRTYKKIAGKKYYSSWSAKKSVRTKK